MISSRSSGKICQGISALVAKHNILLGGLDDWLLNPGHKELDGRSTRPSTRRYVPGMLDHVFDFPHFYSRRASKRCRRAVPARLARALRSFGLAFPALGNSAARGTNRSRWLGRLWTSKPSLKKRWSIGSAMEIK